MNANCYKTTFSKRLGARVAVGEHASSQGKATGAGDTGSGLGGLCAFVGALTLGSALMGAAWAGPAGNALPTGGVVAQGAASISAAGSVMSINQSTAKAVLNWNSFDIGQNAKINITQPGADAVMLNRVTSANPSQIFGQLSANGQVVLVNPNGIVFGKDGSVSASGFTASTLGISDANFMAGNMQFERNGSTAAVLNQGSIKTTGGYVALLGASVSNEGQIETKGGTAYLAAAETVKIPVSGSGRIKLELSPSRINAAVSNAKGGTIVTEGGQVYMQAAALSDAVASILQSGSIDTTGEQGGAVHLLADGGLIKVDGSISANSTHASKQGGSIVIGRDEETGVLAHSTDVNGAKLQSHQGFVETSGEQLAFAQASVQAGQWLLDPYDITIDASNATAIKDSLNANTSVTVTTSSQYNSTGTVGNGDITVSSAIVKTSSNAANLTLTAARHIVLNADITNPGGTIAMSATAGNISQSAGRLTANNVNLTATAGAIGTAASRIQTSAANLGLNSASHQYVTETDGVTIAARTTSNGNIDIATINGTLVVNSANGLFGVNANGTGSVTLSGTASGTSNGLQLNYGITGNTLQLTGVANGSGNGIHYAGVTITSVGAMTLNGTSAGNGAGIYSWAGTMTAGGLITLTGTDNANQGLNFHGGLTINSSGTFAVGQDSVLIRGGSSATGVSMNGMTINNNSTNGNTRIEALTGGIDTQASFNNTITNASTAGGIFMSTGNGLAMAGGNFNVGNKLTITQRSNAGVTLQTSGTGHLYSPAVVNQGTGAVVLAAGTALNAAHTGDATGGNVKVNSGNVTQSSTGQTLIFTGSAANTAAVSSIVNGFSADLYLSAVGANAQNAKSNSAYSDLSGNVIATGSTRVYFREKINLNTTLQALQGITYGQSLPGNINSQVLGNAQNPSTLTNVLAAGTFHVALSSVLDAAAAAAGQGTVLSPSYSSSGNLSASTYQVSVQSNDYTGLSTSLTVTPKTIQTAVLQAGASVYGEAVTGGAVSLGGDVLAGDAVSAAGSVSIAGAAYSSSGQLKAGTYSQTVAGGLSGPDASNYSFAGASAQANYTVTPRALTVLVSDVQTTYGTPASTGSVSTGNVVAGDRVSLSQVGTAIAGGRYSSSGQLQAGSYRQSVSASVVGDDAANYTLVQATASNYVVAPKAITATVTVADKAYDGTNVAALTATSADILAGDSVSVQGLTGTFASKNVARDSAGNALAQAVNVSGTGASLGGADGANYTLANAGSVSGLSARITPKTLNVTGITAASAEKVYDGSTQVQLLTGQAAMVGVVAGDSVQLQSASAVGQLPSPNVAYNAQGQVLSQSVAIDGLSLSGADAGNYTVRDASGVQVKVTPRALTITGSAAANKTADGTTQAQVTPGTLGNLVAGESLVVTATGQFADDRIGSNKAVATQYTLANSTNGMARNYTLAGEVLRAAIVPQVLPLGPILPPGGGTATSRVTVLTGSPLAAVAELGEASERDECAPREGLDCDCQSTEWRDIELCVVPRALLSRQSQISGTIRSNHQN